MDYEEGGLEQMRREAGNALAVAPLGVGSETSTVRSARRSIRTPTVSRDARWVWIAVAAFIAMSVWWLAQDRRVPDWDTGSHMSLAQILYLQVANGRLTAPFTDFNGYPPLVHLLGAITIFVAGFHPMAMILSSNVVFVPLLAFGCFGVGRIAYGSRAGVLAAVFALGSPMFVSMMHEYELDPPQAAMIAVSLWAILASRRFERVAIAAVAGVLSALAMMTKETSVIFLAGPMLVVVARGGWRNWRGLGVFVLSLAIVAGPWYLYHWHDIYGSAVSFTGPGTRNITGGYAVVQQPPHYSLNSLTWYGWNLINQQVLLPFALLFLIGTVLAVARVVRGRVNSENVQPELLAGALVSYAGMTYITFKDPRYTLPMLVYVAVLATGWITQLRQSIVRAALSAGVVALALIYFVGLSTGAASDVRIKLPGAENNILARGQLTLYEKDGWIRGAPQNDGDIPGLMDGLIRDGIRDVGFAVGPQPNDFDYPGLAALAYGHGLKVGSGEIPLSERAYLILGPPGVTSPPPCRRLSDGSGIFVVKPPVPGFDFASMRDDSDPQHRYTFICPGRASVSAP